jgi:hypothetical protein
MEQRPTRSVPNLASVAASSNDPMSALERRSQIARRYKTFWPTMLRTADLAQRAHVLNISCTGARIHAENPLDRGQYVEIAIAPLWLRGFVRWRHEKSFGVAFHEMISEADLENYLTTGKFDISGGV